MEIRRIFKSGDSLVIALPRPMLRALNIRRNDNVCVEMLTADAITISKVARVVEVKQGGRDAENAVN